MKSTSKRRSILSRVLLLVLAAVMVFTFSACSKKEPEPEKPKEPEKVIINNLTGELGLEADKIDTRVVGIVVENHPQARPQWGMDDETNPPDIILEAEVEGGITRMLWLYADYNALPEFIGPIRSARPPFIQFSEQFNAIFVHWGMSNSGGAYTGADYYFNNDGVDHLDGMNYERTAPFDRKQGTGRALEHTAIVYGESLPGTLESKFDTTLDDDKVTHLSFYKTKKARGEKGSCDALSLRFSQHAIGTTDWTYNKDDQKYYSTSFQTNVSRDNLLVLFDTTGYVTKNAKGTYCTYGFAGGDAIYASCGAYQNIKWRMDDNGKLYLYENKVIKDKDGNEKTEEKAVSINPGRTWIGWASANYGGYCGVTAAPEEPEEESEDSSN